MQTDTVNQGILNSHREDSLSGVRGTACYNTFVPYIISLASLLLGGGLASAAGPPSSDAQARAALALASAAAKPPADMFAALVPPTTPAPCPCPSGGECTCGDVCPCPSAYEGQVARALKLNQRLVVFVGVPRRNVTMNVTLGLAKWGDVTQGIVVGVPDGSGGLFRYDLPAEATDAQILTAGKVATTAPFRDAPGTHRRMDSQGNVWAHSDASRLDVAAHMSPFTGEVVWGQYGGPRAPTGQATAVARPVQWATLFRGGSMCVGGNCPR